MAPVMPRHQSLARAARAWELRVRGWSWREVVKELGYGSIGAAQSAVKRFDLREGRPATPEACRAALIENAEWTMRKHSDRFHAACASGDDELMALHHREVIRDRDQLARLTGSYTPERAEVSVTAGLDIESIRTAAYALAEAQPVRAAAAVSALPTIDAEVIEVAE